MSGTVWLLFSEAMGTTHVFSSSTGVELRKRRSEDLDLAERKACLVLPEYNFRSTSI